MKPTLVILCDNYPLGAGEFFLDDEIRVICSCFENIYILTKEQEKRDLGRFIPKNLEVICYKSEISISHKINAIPNIFSTMFLGEFYRAIFEYKIKPKPILLKIMFMDFVRSKEIMDIVNKLIVTKNINVSNVVFYSYWHDYRAFALAQLSKYNRNIISVSRAHGWDVFAERHNPPFLPFKNFIMKNLSKTFSISKVGKSELLKYHVKSKISVSKLGKTNHREVYLEKNSEAFLVCSCSNIISLKRVNLIIELISRLKVEDLTWIHFGDGYMRNEIEGLAKKKLSGIKYEFRGVVPNNEILDFYAENYVDLFVNLSESEGIPVSIMEALSAGIPVLATDVGGTSEAVNEEVGFLLHKDFCMDDAVDIVERYFSLPMDNQLAYRERAYCFWMENYEAEKNYKEFIDDLIGLIKGNSTCS
jgi:colanic acid/amylovoran biosynthesis glycosyltransferase